MATVIVGDRVGKLGKLAVGCSATLFDATGQKMLLACRADSGMWCVPGGYMEPGEDFSEACAREVWEETGLHAKATRLIGIYTTPHRRLEYLDGNRWQLVVLHFEAEIIGGELKPSVETTAFQFVTPAEAEQLPMNDLDRKRVKDGFARSSAAFIHDDL